MLEKVDAKHALERVKNEGYDISISLGTFRRYLREHQISPTQLKRKK